MQLVGLVVLLVLSGCASHHAAVPATTPARVDIFDVQGIRVGWGQERPDGSWEVFNADGTRRGTIQPGPGGDAAVFGPDGRRLGTIKGR